METHREIDRDRETETGRETETETQRETETEKQRTALILTWTKHVVLRSLISSFKL